VADPKLAAVVTEIRGMEVMARGTYVLMDDVIEAIDAYAKAGPRSEMEVILDFKAWFQGAGVPPREDPVEEVVAEPEVHGAEVDDVTEGVARVEIYPDNPDDPRPKWYARTVDTAGYIIKTTNGSFDQAWVIQNAEERFPGIPIHLLKHAGEDSKWQEDSTRGVFPSIGPPVRRMFAGVSAYERNEHGGGQVGP